MADGLNEFYKNKISDLITKIPKTNFDPIAHYKQKIEKPKKILKIKKKKYKPTCKHNWENEKH